MVTANFMSGSGAKEISYQEFVSQLLRRGEVDHLSIVNGNLVQVYTRSGKDVQVTNGTRSITVRPSHQFEIGSADKFEERCDHI